MSFAKRSRVAVPGYNNASSGSLDYGYGAGNPDADPNSAKSTPAKRPLVARQQSFLKRQPSLSDQFASPSVQKPRRQRRLSLGGGFLRQAPKIESNEGSSARALMMHRDQAQRNVVAGGSVSEQNGKPRRQRRLSLGGGFLRQAPSIDVHEGSGASAPTMLRQQSKTNVTSGGTGSEQNEKPRRQRRLSLGGGFLRQSPSLELNDGSGASAPMMRREQAKRNVVADDSVLEQNEKPRWISATVSGAVRAGRIPASGRSASM